MSSAILLHRSTTARLGVLVVSPAITILADSKVPLSQGGILRLKKEPFRGSLVASTSGWNDSQGL